MVRMMDAKEGGGECEGGEEEEDEGGNEGCHLIMGLAFLLVLRRW